MAIEVKFDTRVEVAIRLFARWPVALVEAIGKAKEEMFDQAGRHPLDSSILTGEKTFQLGAHRYRVIYAIGAPYEAETGETVERLHVLRIEDLGAEWEL